MGKALGRVNSADLSTKYLDRRTMKRHCDKLAADFAGCRASTAPVLHLLNPIWEMNAGESHEAELLAMALDIPQSTTRALAHSKLDEFGLMQPIESRGEVLYVQVT